MGQGIGYRRCQTDEASAQDGGNVLKSAGQGRDSWRFPVALSRDPSSKEADSLDLAPFGRASLNLVRAGQTPIFPR